MHIVAAEWMGQELQILGARDGELFQIPFVNDIDWTVLAGRKCVGWIGRDGHRPCPLDADVTADRQCSHCAPAWSDCIFEPILHESPCDLCDREHVVYLALYGGLPKVGMTSAARVEIRLREQGADAFFIIQRTKNRYEARQAEKTVAFLHGLPERRRGKEILSQWTRPVDWSLIDTRAREWQNVLGARFEVEETTHLANTIQPLPARPAILEPEGQHHGQALGAKGNYLFYKASAGPLGGNPVHAVRRSDLVGRRLQFAT